MKNKTLLFISSIISISLIGCNSSSQGKPVEETFIITWQNYDGSTLEIDTEVSKGTMPSYDGNIPTRPDDSEYTYVFNGWNPAIHLVSSNETYTATYTHYPLSMNIEGIEPVISSDRKTVKYGLYPQSHVNDNEIIEELEKLTPLSSGYVLYNNNYYLKQTANVYNNEKYTFDDNTEIVNGNSYWYKVEAITWKVIVDNTSTLSLVATTLLGNTAFYSSLNERTVEGKTIYPNNYEHSVLRNFLNDTFFNEAFMFNTAHVSNTTVDNNGTTTDSDTNPYSSNNLTDKVYTPSYKDVTTYSLSCLKTTDYARANGCWNSKDKTTTNNGSYWTRSPSSEYYYAAWNVNSGSLLSEYVVNENSHSFLPAITFTI